MSSSKRIDIDSLTPQWHYNDVTDGLWKHADQVARNCEKSLSGCVVKGEDSGLFCRLGVDKTPHIGPVLNGGTVLRKSAPDSSKRLVYFHFESKTVIINESIQVIKKI